ncbi:MAG: hypothetical protein H0U96_02225 [Acidobacteria bacterium]|nr:hypothetical protein [Acidobacteriota bacterium]
MINLKTLILFVVSFFIIFVNNNYSHPAWGIVVDRQNQIYFSDLETVYKIDAQGKLLIFRAGVSGRHVHDLAVDENDNIYGLDNSYEPQTQKFFRSIWKMSSKGEFTEIVPLTENLPIGMSIWRDFEGNTFSVEPYNNEKRESKIFKRTPQGKTTLFAGGIYGYLDGKKENAKFGNIVDMAFALDNSIYLMDSDTVRRIDKNGKVSTIFRPQTQQNPKNIDSSSRKLYGLAVDPQNNVFVADFGNKQLLRINSQAQVSTVLNSETDWSPLGVATFGDEVYVLEGRPLSSSKHTGNRVLKISSDNKSTVIGNLEDARNSNDISNPNNFLSQMEQSVDSVSNSESKTAGTKSHLGNNEIGLYSIAGLLIAVILTFGFVIGKNKFAN